ncbi:MAG: hypothetical protein IJ542_04100 [Clostridia bacterium]|nr:hypothetical protein [Clostridia bacterium]
MATETQERVTTQTTVRRGIFSSRENADTQYRRPIFSNLDFEDTSTISVQKHYQSDVQSIKVEGQRKVDMLTIDRAIEQHPETPVKVHLNAHGKILISVIAICICALVAFMIGNAVTLGSLNATLAAKQQVVYEQQQTVNSLQQQYESLENDVLTRATEQGLTEQATGTALQGVTEVAKPTAQIETNWFDSLCNFLAGLFN